MRFLSACVSLISGTAVQNIALLGPHRKSKALQQGCRRCCTESEVVPFRSILKWVVTFRFMGPVKLWCTAIDIARFVQLCVGLLKVCTIGIIPIMLLGLS